VIPGLYTDGITAAEELLRGVYRLEVAKALDPLHHGDFLVIVQRLGRALAGVSRDAEAVALRRALATLDVDWPNLSTADRDRVLGAAREVIAGAAAQVLPRVEHVFETEAKIVVATTRRAAMRRFGLRIDASTTSTDDRIAAFVRRSESYYIRDQYGRRADELGQRARDIVASGLEQGLARDDIVGDLSAALTPATGRSKAYWQVVATSFANRSRTYTQLAAFDEADIETFRFEAVLDSATSSICRFMHGREFSVERAMQRFAEVEAAPDPEAITHLQPWVQVGADDDGNQVLFYKRGDRRHVVAQVDESGVGQNDQVGRYSRDLSTDELDAAGISMPPLHGNCRSSVVAITE
jgi:SPP1 gp7 family putative phage head morphogenesis protein